MINDVLIKKIADGINLHLIKSDKFKTDLIGIYIKRPLVKEDAAKNALITRILERGTEKYNTAQEVSQRLDELYGAILVSDVHKYGEKHVFQFKLQVPDRRYVPSNDIFEESVEMLNEVLNQPLSFEGKFNEDYFAQEKKNMIQAIKALKDDKISYALNRCIEIMCENEAYRIPESGTVEEVEKITSDELYTYYKKMIKESLMDICVIGDIDFDYVEDIIKTKFDFKRENLIELEREEIYIDVEEIKDVEEEMEVTQGKLTLGYRTNVAYESELYEASVLFTAILGGGANSKLFKEIREEKSMSYYIYSTLEKYKSILLVASGINPDDKLEVISLIEKNIVKIQNGEFTEEELNIAKAAISSALRSRSDYPNSYINYYYSQALIGKEVDVKETINKYENVTKEQIVEVSKKIKLDTIHFIKPIVEVSDNNED